MKILRSFLILLIAVPVTIATGIFLVNGTHVQSADEEIFSTVLKLCLAKMRTNKNHVVVLFEGSNTIDCDARTRMIRLVSPGEMTIACPSSRWGLKRDPATGRTLDPSTGEPAQVLFISIEQWRSTTEVEASIVFFPEPSIGCGWKFLMRKYGDSWVVEEILDNWIKKPEGFQSRINYAQQ